MNTTPTGLRAVWAAATTPSLDVLAMCVGLEPPQAKMVNALMLAIPAMIDRIEALEAQHLYDLSRAEKAEAEVASLLSLKNDKKYSVDSGPR
jgi:hypothetical protein